MISYVEIYVEKCNQFQKDDYDLFVGSTILKQELLQILGLKCDHFVVAFLRKQDKLTQCWINFGALSTTLGQH